MKNAYFNEFDDIISLTIFIETQIRKITNVIKIQLLFMTEQNIHKIMSTSHLLGSEMKSNSSVYADTSFLQEGQYKSPEL